MKSKLRVLLCVGSLLASGNAAADVESWYSMWSLGVANLDYSDSTGEYLDSYGSRVQGSLDMLGFYWPMQNKQTIVGGVISGAFDSASRYGTTYQVNQYLYAVSALHFLGSEPGDGFFVRGDFGVAREVTTASNSYYSANSSSGSGSGFLLGAGFGIPVSSQSRLLLSLIVSRKTIESVDYSSTAFSVSGLW